MQYFLISLSILAIVLSILNLTKKRDTPGEGTQVLFYITVGISTLVIISSSYGIYRKSIEISQFEELLQF